MHARIDQYLGDRVPKAVAIEDTDQAIDGGFRVALARQIVCQDHHGKVIAPFDLLGWG